MRVYPCKPLASPDYAAKAQEQARQGAGGLQEKAYRPQGTEPQTENSPLTLYKNWDKSFKSRLFYSGTNTLTIENSKYTF